jgi:hypothetical protein
MLVGLPHAGPEEMNASGTILKTSVDRFIAIEKSHES